MSEAPTRQDVEAVIHDTLRKYPRSRSPKQGNKIHAELANALAARDWVVETEYKVRGEAWVDNEGHAAPALERAIDIAILQEGIPWAFIEVESDLDHAGKTGSGAHYSVKSLARSGSGRRFVSYQSIERMAIAANSDAGRIAIVSDDPVVHNPRSLPLYLVVHNCTDAEISALDPRRRSLGVKLIRSWRR